MASIVSSANQRRRAIPITYWDAGSPSYRWVQWLEQHVVNLGVNTPNATRQMALLNVAIYDAMVAAWDSKYTYKRLPPFKIDSSIQTLVTEADVPSYPNEHAVAAGAAAAILSYLYPSEAAAIQDLAAEEARSRLFAGVALPSDYDSGLKLGDQVGLLVVQRAQSDGSNAVFTGTIPAGPGLWTGTNPVCPLCGTWKTWVLENGSQFRPGPPLPYNSPEKQAELAFLHSQTRPFNDQATAFYWQTQVGIITSWYDFVHNAIFEDHLTGNALRTARMYALMSVSQYDSMVACWDGKYTYWAIRPFQLDSTLTTLFATPESPQLSGGARDDLHWDFRDYCLPFPRAGGDDSRTGDASRVFARDCRDSLSKRCRRGRHARSEGVASSDRLGRERRFTISASGSTN